jgi:hypothetical protein
VLIISIKSLVLIWFQLYFFIRFLTNNILLYRLLPNILAANAIKEIIQQKYGKAWRTYGAIDGVTKFEWFQKFMVHNMKY